ncbi:hypothetical protein GY45DRAFT_1439434 [Cubamyces sp. BRFM 1775]|nr:hypothetical protein GY45DRAFT_1439434 [Cubamyces sp. BRFM 1775]
MGLVYLTERGTRYYTQSDAKWENGEPLSHTVSRGWCLQERLLSTRSLVFTTETLQLRCHTKTQNVGGALHSGIVGVPRLPNAAFHPYRPDARETDELQVINERWWEIVEDYTRRKLSNPSDKLVALSGLAEMFAQALGPNSGYQAGLWRDNLLRDLQWQLTSSFRSPERSSGSYYGPSWSWASIDGEVNWTDPSRAYNLRKVEPCAVVAKVTTTLKI